MTAPAQCRFCHEATDGDSLLCGPCAVELAHNIIDSPASTFHACAICDEAYSDTEPHAKSLRIPHNLCWVCAHLYQSANRPEPILTLSTFM
jgi:hypothetical protein